MFSMNDIGGTGSLSKGEFARMLRFDPHFLPILAPIPTILPFCRSFIEISNCTLSKKQAEDAIGAMMAAAGFDHKEKITWEDFRFLLQDHEKELQFAHLNVKGSTVGLCRGQLNCVLLPKTGELTLLRSMEGRKNRRSL